MSAHKGVGSGGRSLAKGYTSKWRVKPGDEIIGSLVAVITWPNV